MNGQPTSKEWAWMVASTCHEGDYAVYWDEGRSSVGMFDEFFSRQLVRYMNESYRAGKAATSSEARPVHAEDCRCIGSVGPNPACPVHGSAPEPCEQPSAWYRVVRSPDTPTGPSEIDVEFSWGDWPSGEPDDVVWQPLYSRPAQPQPAEQYLSGFKDALDSAAITCARCASLEAELAEARAEQPPSGDYNSW